MSIRAHTFGSALLAATAVLGATVGISQAQPTQVNELAKLLASDGLEGEVFGIAVAIEGETGVIGATSDLPGYNSPGRAFVFELIDGEWRQTAELTASDREDGGQFGRWVAISGNTIMVGAVIDDNDNGVDAGAVYVFEKPAEGWHDMTQTCKLVADDGQPGDRFGVVALSGNTAVIGAPYDDDYAPFAGCAYVFEKGTGWVDGSENQVAKLWAFDAEFFAGFGESVAIRDETILIGAPHGGADASRPGSAYVFEKPQDGWVDTNDETAMLTPSDGQPCDSFGNGVALSADASVILIGAQCDDDDEYGVNTGSAYVFDRPAEGWVDMTENHKITNGPDSQAYEIFGGPGLSLNAAGDIAVIGAYDRDECGTDSGAAYVFRYDCSTWNKEAVLTAADCAAGDRFGLSTAISGDTALIGAYKDDNENGVDAGAAYVFDIGGEPVSVDIDIKPGSYPNSINLGSHGVIPVAILSSCAFDATQVDADTVSLSGAGVAVRGHGNNVLAHEEDADEDGLLDLVVQVVTENLDPDQFQDGYAVLTGTTFAGEEFIGLDEIIIVP